MSKSQPARCKPVGLRLGAYPVDAPIMRGNCGGIMAKRVNKRGTKGERKRIVDHVFVIAVAVQHGTGIAEGREEKGRIG